MQHLECGGSCEEKVIFSILLTGTSQSGIHLLGSKLHWFQRGQLPKEICFDYFSLKLKSVILQNNPTLPVASMLCHSVNMTALVPMWEC